MRQTFSSMEEFNGRIEPKKDGLIWRIGNGESIKVWTDRWIPRPSTFMIQTPIASLDVDAKVAELIDTDLKWWKESLLGTLFTSEEVDLIKSIPINIGGKDDKLVWHFSNNGLFSVKSAYHLHEEVYAGTEGGSPTR